MRQNDPLSKKQGIPKGACICAHCGEVGKPVTRTKGSIWIEILLWLTFLVPGLIYSVWRLTTKYKGCPSCGAANPVPLNTPRGQKLYAEYSRSS